VIFEECVSVTKQLHQFLLVAARLQFVEERGELLVIEFYPLTRRLLTGLKAFLST
jgi:hypothetical protein